MTFNLNVSMDGASETIGAARGILTAANSTVFGDDVARIFYSNMSTELDRHARNLAIVNPEKYGHMYDWGMRGLPAGKLWKNQLLGSKNKRSVTYSFLPSRVPVPELTNANTGIDEEELSQVTSNGKHMFPAKAMVFELGLRTTIKPKRSKVLFIPLWHINNNGKKSSNYRGRISQKDRDRGFVFSSASITQDHGKTRGAFTSLYLMFYETQSERVFLEKVEPRVSRPIRKVYLANTQNLGGGSPKVSKLKRPSSKTFSVAAVVDHETKTSKHLMREMNKAVTQAKNLLEEIDAE